MFNRGELHVTGMIEGFTKKKKITPSNADMSDTKKGLKSMGDQVLAYKANGLITLPRDATVIRASGRCICAEPIF